LGKRSLEHLAEALDRSGLRLPAATRYVAHRRQSRFLGASVVAFSIFSILLILVRSQRSAEADLVATMRIQKVKHPLLARAMGVVSWMGFQPQSLLLPAGTVSFAWLFGSRRDAKYLILAWGGSLISYTTKRLIKRPRPTGEGITVVVSNLKDTSFPSGHTLHYTAFWGFVSYLLYSRLRGNWLRFGPIGVVGALIGLVGPSRVYLGHHWLTDVLASYCLGTGYLVGLIGIHSRGDDR
jgi:membrane-associated phospholipid phosphatase